jgi:SAM-dependent methyltransferase
MNILEMAIKKSRHLVLEVHDPSRAGWHPGSLERLAVVRVRARHVRTRGPKEAFTDRIRGFAIPPGTRIVVRDAAVHFRDFAVGKGYFYSGPIDGPTCVSAGWRGADGTVSAVTTQVDGPLAELHVPAAPAGMTDLVIEVPPDAAHPLAFGVHRLLDRRYLYSLCTGAGVEIGPGPKPQILPSDETAVRYVEQSPPQKWAELYGGDSLVPVDDSLWDHYVVGNADAVPVEPGSLDFVFSSHVVEHLANPLGHFAYWSTLLKPGGRVVAVIPDREGCKDFVFRRSSTEEIEAEFRAGAMGVELRHYERWAKHRLPGHSAQNIMESGRSIHVHFYTAKSMRDILARFHAQAGYSAASIISSQNHKDFFVILEK